jgi:hypothetical protein
MGCGGRSGLEVAVVDIVERGEEATVCGVEVSVGEESLELRPELELSPP